MKKTILFLLCATFACTGFTQTCVTAKQVGVNYTTKKVTFKLEWSSCTGTHNYKVWVFVDVRPEISPNVKGAWTRAKITHSDVGTPYSENGEAPYIGVWVTGSSYTSQTVTLTLDTPYYDKFDWCAFATDYPPNVTLDKGTYTFKGTPQFVTSHQPVPGKTIVKNNLTVDAGTTFTDATGCPGIGSLYCPYTGDDLYMDPTHLCRLRPSGEKNWEAWIKDIRDDRLYRIVLMPAGTGTWWMAEDLMWDGKPNPTATNYTIRGTAYTTSNPCGCGRHYAPNATGSGAYSGNGTQRRASDACPVGWQIPNNNEICDYVTGYASNSQFLSSCEFGGSDTFGISLLVCGGVYSTTTDRTTMEYMSGNSLIYKGYRSGGDSSSSCGYTSGDWGFVRCVRNL